MSHADHIKTVRSVIDADTLIPVLSEAYNISAPITCYLHTVGDSDTYLVQVGSDQFVIRIYYPNRFWLSGIDEYRFELDWLSFWQAQGLPVSTAIPNKNGELLNDLQAPEGIYDHAKNLAPCNPSMRNPV